MLYEPSIFNDKISILQQFEALKQYIIGFDPGNATRIVDYDFNLDTVIPDTVPRISGSVTVKYQDGRSEHVPYEFPFAITGSETIVVDINENTDGLEIHLDSEVVSKLSRAILAPVAKPSQVSLFAIDTTGAQVMLTLGDGLTIENGVLKVTGAAPGEKTTTVTFYEYTYSVVEDKNVYKEVGTYTTTDENPYVSIDYCENDGTNSVVTFTGETILSGTGVDDRKMYTADGTEIINAGGTYDLTQGETYTFYVLFASDEFVPPTSGATTTVTFKWNDGTTIGTYTSNADPVYIYGDTHYGDGLGVYFGAKVTGDPDWGDSYPDAPPYNDYQITSAAYVLEGFSVERNGAITIQPEEWHQLVAGQTYTYYVRHDSEQSTATTTATFYLKPSGGGAYEDLGTFTTEIENPYVRVHDDDGQIGSYSGVDFSGQTVYGGNAVDNIVIYKADGTPLAYETTETAHVSMLTAGETYNFYLIFESDSFLDPTAVVTTVNLYAPYANQASGQTVYKWTTTKTNNLQVYVDSMNVIFSDDSNSSFGQYQNGKIEFLGLSKTKGGNIFLQPEHGITITPGTTNDFYLVYTERALPITTLKLWATVGDTTERTLHTYITTAESPYLYGDDAEGAGAGVRFGEYETTDWVYTSAWYSLEGFSAYASGDPVWQPAFEWIPLVAGATYELYTIEYR